MSTLAAQLGIVAESTYGTPVTVTRFFEARSWPIQLERNVNQMLPLRTSTRLPRADRFAPATVGAAGTIEMDVPTKGWGIWLRHMLGTSSTSAVVDSNYTHTGTVGSLLGDSLTIQSGTPQVGSATVTPFTWHGCKVTDWELSCAVDEYLMAKIGIDAEDEDNSTGLATASYPTSFNLFDFGGASATVAGAAFECTSISFAGNNNLDTARRFIRGSALKKEPIENGHREYTWSAEAEFTSTTQYARFTAALASGMHTDIVATFLGPVAHGGTTVPRVLVTVPAARFDKVGVPVAGPDTIKQSLSGTIMDNGTDEPISVAYRTTDATA